MIVSLLLSCSNNNNELEEIEARIAQLESQGKDLKNQEDQLAKEGDQLQSDIDSAKDQINQLTDQLDATKLLSFEFLSSDNPLQVVEDVRAEILDDNSVEIRILNIMSSKTLIPRFQFSGQSLTMDGKAVESGKTAIDFSKPVTLTINGNQKSVSYTVYVHSYTGLPLLWIETAGRVDIIKNNWYYNADLKLVEGVRTRAAGDVVEADIRIKGLPPLEYYISKVHTSGQMAKNDYVLNFNDRVSLLDEAADTDWELSANRDDNTLIRTQTGLFMGSISNLNFTPKFHFVDLMLNGRYYGCYRLGERLEVSTSRINIGFDGYLLKIDETTTGIYMGYNTLEQPVSIMAPSLMTGDSKYVYIRQFMNAAEEALFSVAFTTENMGWQKYMDIDSFVDWYLINEIAKNYDAVFQHNCYMYKKNGEKLKMGPLWDFRKGFGNGDDSSTSGFVVKNAKWFDRLFQDPAFVTKVKERFTYFYSHKNDILNEINENAKYLKYSAQENNNKWGIYDSYGPAENGMQYFQKEVDKMKAWLEGRMDWLNQEFSKM
jgi:outer membrane murein-binding lipoprotein Lpp